MQCSRNFVVHRAPPTPVVVLVAGRLHIQFNSSSSRPRLQPPCQVVGLHRAKATTGSSSGPVPDNDASPLQDASSSQQAKNAGAPASPSTSGQGQTPAQQQPSAVPEATTQPPDTQTAPATPSVADRGPVSDTAATGPAGSSSSSSLGGVQESSGAGSATVGGGGGAGGPSAVTLLSRFNGVGYTFVLAGFLKIMTVGGLTLSTPTDVARTAFGKATPYLMVPVGLGMCWVAKQVVDTGLNESKRFLQYLVAAMVVLYFGLTKLMYKYDPQADVVRRPRPRMPGQMAELRAQLGDRELLAAGDMDSSRFYQAERPGNRELYDDVAWYEGRYPSQLAAPGQQQKRGGSRRAALAVTDTEEEYSVAANLDAMGSRMGFGGGGSAEPTAAVKGPVRRSFLSDSNR